MSVETKPAESIRGRVLRESSETAARERARLEASAGRSRLAALLHRAPERARHLGSEEAARSGLRYQPVAWTAIVVAAVAFYFPGRPEPEAGTVAALPPRAVTLVAPTTTVPPAPVTPAPVPPPSATFTPPPTVFTPPPSRSTSPTTMPVAAAQQPLTVRGFGWASSLSGVGTAEVPDGTMPVASRLGQLDKASFVRLSGTATTLTLVEEPSGAREAIGPGVVVACPISDAGWAEEPDQSMDDAPAWDAARCVAGVEQDDTWTFDLSGFDDRTGDTGFALVPDASAPPDFQVTFRAS